MTGLQPISQIAQYHLKPDYRVSNSLVVKPTKN